MKITIKIKKKTTTTISAAALITVLLMTNIVVIASSSITPNITDFYTDKIEADVNEPLQFNFTCSDSNIISYFLINFHDGTPPEKIMPDKNSITHSFQYEGKYMVTLFAVAFSGLIDQSTCEVEIRNNAPILEDFNMPNYGYEDDTIDFSVGSVIDSEIDIDELYYIWDVGTGSYKYGPSVNYSWSDAGFYPITLTVIDDQGALDSMTKYIEIKNVIPIADFEIQKIKEDCPFVISIGEDGALVYENCPIVFNASKSTDSISDIDTTMYYWDFGNGQILGGIVAYYEFVESGEYNVILSVKDDNGAVGTAQKTITVVNEPPKIEIKSQNVILKEGETFVFEANATDSLPDLPQLNYSWSFGKEGWRASNFFNDDYNDTVSVSVSDPEGLIASDSTKVLVENVNPHINIDWAYVEMNITLAIKGLRSKEANFSFEIIQDNDTIAYLKYSKPAGQDYFKAEEPLVFFMDLSRNYTFIVNRTHELPCGIYWVYLTFSFKDGNDFTLWDCFNEFWKGWKMCPNEWVIDPKNYIYDMPVTFAGSVFDPGADDIHIEANFKIDILLEINFTFAKFFCFPIYFQKKLCCGRILELLVYNKSGLVYVDINITETLINETFENEDGLPSDIPLNPTIYPVDLSFLEMLDLLCITDLLDIKIIKALNTIEVNVSDDDGGTDFSSTNIDTSQGKFEIENVSPKGIICTYDNATEDTFIPMFLNYKDFDGDNMTIIWSFGDGSTPFVDPLDGSYIYHSYSNEGYYLITTTLSDGKKTSKMGKLIRIDNIVPEVQIKPFLNISEGEPINTYDMYVYGDSVSDEGDLQFYWDYGDTLKYYQLNTYHIWQNSGLYPLTLYVIDDNGAIGTYTRWIEILNTPPVIEGPFGFQSIEGSPIIFDLAIYDSFSDDLNLDYTWNISGEIIHELKPVVILNDGYHNISLSIEDNEGAITNANITVIIEDITPIVTATNKMIYGAPGEIKLSAYAQDTFLDFDFLTFNWNINNETYYQTNGGYLSDFMYSYDSTSVIMGTVDIVDNAGRIGTCLFEIQIIMDSDGDGLTDEQEVEFGLSPDNDDTDGDFLTDWYEINVYGTDPMNPDTDDDGLPDGYSGNCGEFMLGTDPLNADTDSDNLTDGFEFFGWILTIPYLIDSETEEYENKTYWTNSNPLLVDTDGDKVTDWEEYNWNTDPRKVDSDGDGLDDLVDLFPWKVDADGDGLFDQLELEFGTDPNKTDTDDDGLSDSEEYYPGFDGYITNGTDPDTDNDYLLDSAEIYTIREEIREREKISKGDNSFSLQTGNTLRTLNASVTISISVANESLDATDLTISLLLQGKELFKHSNYNQRYFVDIIEVKHLIDEKVGGYGGRWVLKVTCSEECLLEEYKIEILTFLNPLDADSDNDGLLDGVEVDPVKNNGWITNPTKSDTDQDTISDKVEISRGWNPLSKDTDGDGVDDWRDSDPLHNLIVKVKVKEGYYDSWAQILTPSLQATLEVVADPNHKYEVATPRELATGSPKPITIWMPWICSACWDVCLPWWLGGFCFPICVVYPCLKEVTLYTIYRTAYFNDEYYFDVDDGDRDVSVTGTLWKNYLLGSESKVRGTIYHPLMKSGDHNTQYDKKISQGSNWLTIDIETIGVSRVNTIAIYEKDTFYNRYPEQEKMTVILLDVAYKKGNFDKGINAILVPTSLFTNTMLHSIIETSVNDDGEVVSDEWQELNGAEIGGIDRKNYGDSISANMECVITKDVTPNEAKNILNLVLTSANQSEGMIYLFKKQCQAETLNLAPDVLKLIPLAISQYKNSPTGEWPRTWWENFIQIIVTIVTFIIDVLIAIANFFIELFKWIADIGMNLVKAITEAAMKVVEAIIKAIILVFLYLMFALLLIVLIPMYYLSWPGFMIMANNLGIIPVLGVNYITIQDEDTYIDHRYEFGLQELEFLDIYSPSFSFILSVNDEIYIQKFWIFGFESTDMKTFAEDIIEDYTNNQTALDDQQDSNNPKISINTPKISGESDFSSAFLDGVAASLDTLSIFLTLDSILSITTKTAKWVKNVLAIALIATLSTLIFSQLVMWFELPDPIEIIGFILGAATGFVAAGLVFLISIYLPAAPQASLNFINGIGTFITILGAVLGIIGTGLEIAGIDEFFLSIPWILAITSFTCALIVLSSGKDKVMDLAKWVLMSITLGLVLLVIGIVVVVNNFVS